MNNKDVINGWKNIINNKEPQPTDKYKHFNHFHELSDTHLIVDYGDGEFIANKEAIPLLEALNDLGIRTRTHHIDSNSDSPFGFFSILLDDDMSVEIHTVNEVFRDKYNGQKELLIRFKYKDK